MHILRIKIEGFKNYAGPIQPEDFSPHHNCIVGANGSGKSNFFAAIQFCLDVFGSNIRAEERKAMLHEGHGMHVMQASVEITFSNKDRRLPFEQDEVTIKRQIGLKKDEYFVDRKHTTKTEVSQILETAGISRSNPYNIVPQGKVNALVLMKDTGRLEMFKDIAGINTYDERRSESVAMMDETQSKQVRANASPRGRASARARTHGPRSMHAHTSTRWTPSDYRRAISC